MRRDAMECASLELDLSSCSVGQGRQDDKSQRVGLQRAGLSGYSRKAVVFPGHHVEVEMLMETLEMQYRPMELWSRADTRRDVVVI